MYNYAHSNARFRADGSEPCHYFADQHGKRRLLQYCVLFQVELATVTGGGGRAMCFSAAANFVGSGVLATVGVATLTKVKHRRELLFASLPALFAIHQFIEGFVRSEE